MKKHFKDCDVLSVLERIGAQCLGDYKEELKIDQDVIEDELSDNKNDFAPLHFLWLCCSEGVHLIPEALAYFEDPTNPWTYYGEEKISPVTAYAITISKVPEGERGSGKREIVGDLYELDYEEHFQKVMSLQISKTTNWRTGKEEFDAVRLADILCAVRKERESEKYEVYTSGNWFTLFINSEKPSCEYEGLVFEPIKNGTEYRVFAGGVKQKSFTFRVDTTANL
jgi:hypothetical protein